MSDNAHQQFVPVPDPTILTTEQLHREVAGLREVLQARLDGMDKAAILLNENVTRFPTEVDKQIAHLRELMLEKFNSVDKQFEATAQAVHAQNESNTTAINKSEKTNEKQFDNLSSLISTNVGALNDKIGLINSRIDTGAGATTGHDKGQQTNLAYIVALVAILGLAYTVFKGQNPPIIVSPLAVPAPAKAVP